MITLFQLMLARPFSRSVANVPVTVKVYCAGATAVLIMLAGVRGTGVEEEEAPLPPNAVQTGQDTPAIKIEWSSNGVNGQGAMAK